MRIRDDRPLQMPSPKRFLAIDVARGLAIFLVIFAHSLEIFMNRPSVGPDLFEIWKAIYSFHIPLFFFLSGFVSQPHGPKERLTRALTLILMTMICDVTAWGLQRVLGQTQGQGDFLLNQLGLYHQTLIVTWFLPALALIQILDQGLHHPNRIIRWASGIVLLLAPAFHLNTHLDIFQSGALFPGWLFFSLGRCLSRRHFLQEAFEIAKGRLHRSFLFLFFAVWLDQLNLGCLLNPMASCPNLGSHFAVFLIHGEVGFPPYFFLAALAGSLSLLEGSVFLAARLPRIASKIGFWGEKSLFLLIANGFFLSLIQIPYLRDASFNGTISGAAGLFLTGVLAFTQIALLPLSERLLRPLLAVAGEGAKRCLLRF